MGVLVNGPSGPRARKEEPGPRDLGRRPRILEQRPADRRRQRASRRSTHEGGQAVNLGETIPKKKHRQLLRLVKRRACAGMREAGHGARLD